MFTELITDMVKVLQHEIHGVLVQAYSDGLILHEKGGRTRQAAQEFLDASCSQTVLMNVNFFIGNRHWNKLQMRIDEEMNKKAKMSER